MLKSRLSTPVGRGAEPDPAQEAQPSVRDRLSRFTGVVEQAPAEQPEADESPYKDRVAPLETDREMGKSEALAAPYGEAAKAVEASQGEAAKAVERRGRKPMSDEQKAEARQRREASKPVKKSAEKFETPVSVSVADVRADIKELEGKIKETKQRHHDELEMLRARYVELSGKLFSIVSA